MAIKHKIVINVSRYQKRLNSMTYLEYRHYLQTKSA